MIIYLQCTHSKAVKKEVFNLFEGLLLNHTNLPLHLFLSKSNNPGENITIISYKLTLLGGILNSFLILISFLMLKTVPWVASSAINPFRCFLLFILLAINAAVPFTNSSFATFASFCSSESANFFWMLFKISSCNNLDENPMFFSTFIPECLLLCV